MNQEFRCVDATKEILWLFTLQYAILKLEPKFSDKSYYILRPAKTYE